MHTVAYIHPNLYKDSVALMRVAQRLLALPGVVDASLLMGNPANKDILAEAGLLGDGLKAAGPSDIMVVVQARTAAAGEAARLDSQAQLAGHADAGPGAAGVAAEAMAARTVAMGLAQWAAQQPAGTSALNLAQISVPGAYAAAEALKSLQAGLNVFMFSDNVPLAHEVAIKQEAARKGLLVMGPDCGTAIIGGVPLGFANQVRRGSIGVVAASGTGLQEVTTQIHRMGGGISHAIGTGGRDVYAEVGGATMLQGISLLSQDPATRVMVVISKPPAPEVTEKVMRALQSAGKPAVVLFLGSQMPAPARSKGAASVVKVVHTLVDAAAAALNLAGLRRQPTGVYAIPKPPRFAKSQAHLRALYSGGTYAAEAQVLWRNSGLKVWSNVALDANLALPNPKRASRDHTALDLGDDDFTVGRPHPMIDASARIERLRQEAADASVRVILLDVVIGWGAHADPALELAAAVQQAKRDAAKAGRAVAFIGFVCGTELDPQRLSAQEAQLRAAGMVLAGNSANAAWLAGQWLR
jgi:succinyl-CoA synthetase alpha subunit